MEAFWLRLNAARVVGGRTHAAEGARGGWLDARLRSGQINGGGDRCRRRQLGARRADSAGGGAALNHARPRRVRIAQHAHTGLTLRQTQSKTTRKRARPRAVPQAAPGCHGIVSKACVSASTIHALPVSPLLRALLRASLLPRSRSTTTPPRRRIQPHTTQHRSPSDAQAGWLRRGDEPCAAAVCGAQA